MLHHVIQVLVSAAGKTDEDRAGAAFTGNADRVGEGVRTFNGRNDALMAGEQEERFNGVIVIHGDVVDAAHVMQHGVLGADGGIIQPAGVGIDGGGVAIFIGEHDAVEAVHHALFAVSDGRGVITHAGAAAERLYPVDLHRVCKEGHKHTDGIGAAADAGDYFIRQVAGLGNELLTGFIADDLLDSELS